MLGKLIKNEFIQRGKQTALILAGVLLYSIIECFLNLLVAEDIIVNSYFEAFVTMTTVLYGFIMLASAIGIILLMFLDFGKRLFKDQGYLTHTLPVKTRDIMLSRIVFDVTAMLAMIIVYPLCICIVARNFNFYSELIDMLHMFLSYTGSGIDKATITLDLALAVIAMFLSAILAIWQYNAAYALGHSFSGSKRVMSVVFYIVIYTIMQIISGIFVAIISIPSVSDAIINALSSIQSDVIIALIMLLFTDIISLVAIIILIKITINICQKKLNLE